MSIDDLSAYRTASEILHRDHAAVAAKERAAHYRMLWKCGLAGLIRSDFYSLLALPEQATGSLLDAGCGTGFDVLSLRQQAPAQSVYGVDVSAVALTAAAGHPGSDAIFYQAALERLPFAAAGFDSLYSHEVIEHVEDPAAVLREFSRVLKPGGICVVATPNGASWWIEHLRQRAMRLIGRRGAPVGEDHTRAPRFWRREFERAGFVVERQMFDGAALEFLLFVAPACWMPALTRLLEPLRAVPGINLALCDRVKFRLRKAGQRVLPSGPAALCCPLCHANLSNSGSGLICGNRHRFGRNAVGLIDFVAPLADPAPFSTPLPIGCHDETPPVPRSAAVRRLRRLALLGFGVIYSFWLLLLMPLGSVVGLFFQPFRSSAAPER